MLAQEKERQRERERCLGVMRYEHVSIARKIETLRQLPKQRYGEHAVMYLSDKVHSIEV